MASPIALATKLAEPPPEEGGGPADFLSSIEIAVVDRADVLLMQNWAHVVTGESMLPSQHSQGASPITLPIQPSQALDNCLSSVVQFHQKQAQHPICAI